MSARRRWMAIAAMVLAFVASTGSADASGREASMIRSGVECAPVSTLRLPVEGGCVLQGKVERSELRLVTPLGLVPAAYCDGFDLRLVLDGSGSAWIDGVFLNGGDACGDIRACKVPGTSADRPWEGAVHIDRDRSVHIHFDTCYDTCFGLFEGRQRFELERRGKAWRLVADKAQLGSTAFELEAEWRLEGSRGLEARRSRPSF